MSILSLIIAFLLFAAYVGKFYFHMGFIVEIQQRNESKPFKLAQREKLWLTALVIMMLTNGTPIKTVTDIISAIQKMLL